VLEPAKIMEYTAATEIREAGSTATAVSSADETGEKP
jgi:hypothetical protein